MDSQRQWVIKWGWGRTRKWFHRRQVKNSKKKRNGQCIKCCKKVKDEGPAIGLATDLMTCKNCLWKAVDEHLMGVDSRDNRRIESEIGKYKHLFKKRKVSRETKNMGYSWRWSDIKEDLF